MTDTSQEPARGYRRKLHLVCVLFGDGPERTIRSTVTLASSQPVLELTEEAVAQVERDVLGDVRKVNPKVQGVVLVSWQWLAS